MSDELEFSSWLRVNDGCRMRFQVNDGDGTVDLMLGHSHHGLEMVFSPAALDRLVTLGSEALAKWRTTEEF